MTSASDHCPAWAMMPNKPLALLKVASDQQMEAAGQLHDPDQSVVIGALRRFKPAIIGLQPTGVIEYARLQRADIAGKPLPGRRRHQ